MCLICDHEYIMDVMVDMTILDCSGCTSITSIPDTLVDLVYLDCSGCTSIMFMSKYNT